MAMGMMLGAAEDLLYTDPEATQALIGEARDASARALVELRILVTGIHPTVLADRGLADAVRALALDAGLHVEVTTAVEGRPPAPVESAAYFAVSELLANVSKHSGARRAGVDLRHTEGVLQIDVTDNGCGGANPTHGTGIRGIERRVAAFDGSRSAARPVARPSLEWRFHANLHRRRPLLTERWTGADAPGSRHGDHRRSGQRAGPRRCCYGGPTGHRRG